MSMYQTINMYVVLIRIDYSTLNDGIPFMKMSGFELPRNIGFIFE